jgi:hypothetical protein
VDPAAVKARLGRFFAEIARAVPERYRAVQDTPGLAPSALG